MSTTISSAGKEVPLLRSRQHNHAGVHPPGRAPRPGSDGDSGCGQRLSWPARRHDHRRHLSGGRHRHGRAAPDEGLDPGGEHCANRGLDRRVGGGGRDLHHSGVRDLRRLAGLRLRARLLEVVDPDAGRRRARHSLRDPAAARDGGRSRASLPGVGGRLADSHRRTTRQPRRQDSVRQHGFRRPRLPAGPVQPVQRQQGFHRQRRQPGHELCPHGPLGYGAQAARGRSDHHLCARHQPGVPRRRLHHRPAPGFAELRRRRHRLGPAGSADPVPRRPNLRRAVRTGGHHASRQRFLGRTGRRRLELHRAPDRRRRHAGGRLLHAVPHAQEPGLGHGARSLRLEEVGRCPRRHRPHRTRPERQVRLRRVAGRSDQHDLLVHELRRLRGGPASSRPSS